MPYTPLVSIVIPVYKGAQYMRTAIDSALAQTYKNVEIIVVNDGSPDDGETERIALSYGDAIRYFHKENGGCASALNFGISKMRGEWFSWLSHDDVYEPEKIEKQIRCVCENGLDSENTVISCNAKIIDQNGDPIRHPETADCGLYEDAAFVKRLLFGSSLNGCGLLLPKAVLCRVGDFSTELKFVLDWEYWLRAALSGTALYRMGNERLVMNRVHTGQVTVREANSYKSELQQLSEKLFPTVAKTEDTAVISCFYTFAVVKGQKDIGRKYAALLKQRKAFSAGLLLRSHAAKAKKSLRPFCAKCYWKFIRWCKK